MATAKRTHDHDEIRKWIEDRDGTPSMVTATEDGAGGGLLRVDFGKKEDSLDPVSWEDFFATFEEKNLDFLYQDEKDSRFFKFVERE